MSVNLAVIYYSSTGTNYQLAQWAEEGGTETGRRNFKKHVKRD